MNYQKLDPELEDIAKKCVMIHADLHKNGFRDMTGEEFGNLYYSNLNNYIAFTAHAIFDSGLKDAVIVLGDVLPHRRQEIREVLDHNQKGLRFTVAYDEEIKQYKRKVAIQVLYLDGSSDYAVYGVKDLAARKANNNN